MAPREGGQLLPLTRHGYLPLNEYIGALILAIYKWDVFTIESRVCVFLDYQKTCAMLTI